MATTDRSDLSGLRVLVTRPVDRAVELVAALEAAGARVFQQPLLAIASLHPVQQRAQLQRCRNALLDLDHYQRLIFISVNAVVYGVDLIEQLWPQWPLGIKVYAIGEATAAALTQRHIVVARQAAAMNSESLLASAELQHLPNEKILIIRGVGGREHLAQQLQGRGARVDYAECYQRLAPTMSDGELQALLVKQQLDAVCLNSGETLANFHRHCPPGSACPEPYLVLPSSRVWEQARALGYSRLIQADNAGTGATLSALRQIKREDNERR